MEKRKNISRSASKLRVEGNRNLKLENFEYFPEKSLTEIGCDVNTIDGWQKIEQTPKEYLSVLLTKAIRNHNETDVQIRVGVTTFDCHLIALQCHSKIFADISKEKLIVLPEEKVTPKSFAFIYNWMMSDDPQVHPKGILELLTAAKFLRVEELVKQCWACLDSDVYFQEDNAFAAYKEAQKYGLPKLEQSMSMRICKFFLTLVASNEFLELSAREVAHFLASNTVGVNSEVEIFMSLVRWLDDNWSGRETFMLSLMKCVRFGLMPPWFLVALSKEVDCEEIYRIVCHADVKSMIREGFCFITAKRCYGGNRTKFLEILERYDLEEPAERQWIFDKECSYHVGLEDTKLQQFTYAQFLDHLNTIATKDKNYWRNYQLLTEAN